MWQKNMDMLQLDVRDFYVYCCFILSIFSPPIQEKYRSTPYNNKLKFANYNETKKSYIQDPERVTERSLGKVSMNEFPEWKLY